MAKALKKGKRTETLSLRLSAVSRFSLDFMARISGWSITQVVEQALKLSMKEQGLDKTFWEEFWDVNEGMRQLKVLISKNPKISLYPDEYELLLFIREHWVFFFDTDIKEETLTKNNIIRQNVDILWPQIADYQELWEGREKGYWTAGNSMVIDLKQAGLATPEWPPVQSTSTGN